LEQIMKVQVRTNHETSVKWINILCISTGLMVGIIMVTPYLPGKETAQTPPKAAVRFSLGDDNADAIVTTRQQAPIVQRNVDRLRENGLRYQQPETGLRNQKSAAAAPRTLDPSKDPIISTVPKAPIITSSEAIALKKQREAEEAIVQTTKTAEQKTEVVADSAEHDFSTNDKSANEQKSKDLVVSQDPNKAIPKQSGFALPEFDFSAIDLSAIELPTIELPELAKVFEFGSEQISLPTESNEPKIDADAIVRQHLRKQDSITNGPVQPDMDLIAKGNLPAINYPNQQLPGLTKNMALVRGLNANAAIIDTDSAADRISGQLTRDIDIGSSFVPTPIRVKPATPVVAVEQKPAPIVSKEEKAIELQSPPIPKFERTMEPVTEILAPGISPNPLRKQPASVQSFADPDTPAKEIKSAPPSKPTADLSFSGSSIETAVNAWDSALKQPSSLWQLGGLARCLKSTSAAGSSATHEAVWIKRNAKRSPSLWTRIVSLS
jgi:hypothetical protein